MIFVSDTHLNLTAERAYNTVFTNSTLLPLLLLSLARQKNSPEIANSIKEEYDYIVVGAGTAGSVVAARLSEIPCVSVLLLEAGPPPPKLNDIVGIGFNFWLTDLNWQYKTAPQRYTGRGLNNRVPWPSGKGLGGTSLLNAALHVRGNRKDYDDWEAMGATGWSYKDVLSYFKKLEDNRDPEYVANGYHGVGGPVTTMKPGYNPEIQDAIFRAARSMGYKILDSNGKRQTGFYDHQATMRDNQRCSTAKAYLVPAEHRRNFDILPNAMVEKIIIKSHRATGVLFSFDGNQYEVRARREVIMSAGVVNTAQLLMLSGIGPRQELQKFNIPVQADLPVGQNLQDHVTTTVDYILSPSSTSFPEKLMDPENIKLYIHNRIGPLTSTEGIINIAFLLNDEIQSKRDEPNYALHFSEGATVAYQTWNYNPEFYEQLFAPYENRSILLCASSVLSPASRGTVTLRSANPYDEPVIDPNYFEDPRDVEVIVEGLKTCRRLANNPYMKKVGARLLETLYPGCEKYAHDEDKYLRCQVRTALLPASHNCGTAKMGNPRDPSTVVDPKLRVKSIQGLRVVDNSIMPKLVRANTAVPAIMIGEKAADIIKETIHCNNGKHEPDYYDDDHREDEEFPDFEDYEHTLRQDKPELSPQHEYDIDCDAQLNLATERAYNTIFTNSTLLPLLLLSLARQKNSPETADSINEEYDYVVVGAGTAGSVVAARLSEIPCVSILLLEAGPPPPKLNDVVVIGRSFWFTDLDWQYKTTPQKYTGSGLKNRQLTWPGGKGLGGSSLLNGALYVRGNRKDYDDWEAMGAIGWSYKDVLPYFKKLEDNRDPEYAANGYHGIGGPVTVMKPNYDPETKSAISRAARAMGYKFVDSNGKRQTGFYDHQASMRDGQRCSTAKAYLVPAEHRKNLDILPNAMVEKVIIKNHRATGVLFSFEGHRYEVRARREVIMSAGAVNTAQLLMLSGIGPKEELQKFNIPVHADLPVGQNLQDHPVAITEFVLSPSIREISETLSDPDNIKLYIHNRTGPLASSEGVTNIAFLFNDEIRSERDQPNYGIYFAEASLDPFRQQFNIKPKVYQQVYGPYENQALLICFSSQLSPYSRGSVTLRSANPYDEPMIDPNYLEDPRDVQDVVEGLKACRRIVNNPYMKEVGAQPLETLYPGCEEYADDEDKYFRCQVQTYIISPSHACGTTKMGNPGDPSTVVDPKLRVKHIQGLRVVDNSIMPKLVRANTGIPAMMIGEKASDIIKETIHCHSEMHESDYYYDNHKENTKFPDSEDYEHFLTQRKPDQSPQDEYDVHYDEEREYPLKENHSKGDLKKNTSFLPFDKNYYGRDAQPSHPPVTPYGENDNFHRRRRPPTGIQEERGFHLQAEISKNPIQHHVLQMPYVEYIGDNVPEREYLLTDQESHSQNDSKQTRLPEEDIYSHDTRDFHQHVTPYGEKYDTDDIRKLPPTRKGEHYSPDSQLELSKNSRDIPHHVVQRPDDEYHADNREQRKYILPLKDNYYKGDSKQGMPILPPEGDIHDPDKGDFRPLLALYGENYDSDDTRKHPPVGLQEDHTPYFQPELRKSPRNIPHQVIQMPDDEYDADNRKESEYLSTVQDNHKDDSQQRRPISSPEEDIYGHDTRDFRPFFTVYGENYNAGDRRKPPPRGMQEHRSDLLPDLSKNSRNIPHPVVQKPDINYESDNGKEHKYLLTDQDNYSKDYFKQRRPLLPPKGDIYDNDTQVFHPPVTLYGENYDNGDRLKQLPTGIREEQRPALKPEFSKNPIDIPHSAVRRPDGYYVADNGNGRENIFNVNISNYDSKKRGPFPTSEGDIYGHGKRNFYPVIESHDENYDTDDRRKQLPTEMQEEHRPDIELSRNLMGIPYRALRRPYGGFVAENGEEREYVSDENLSKYGMKKGRPFLPTEGDIYGHNKPDLHPVVGSHEEDYDTDDRRKQPPTGMQEDRRPDLQQELSKNPMGIPYRAVRRRPSSDFVADNGEERQYLLKENLSKYDSNESEPFQPSEEDINGQDKRDFRTDLESYDQNYNTDDRRKQPATGVQEIFRPDLKPELSKTPRVIHHSFAQRPDHEHSYLSELTRKRQNRQDSVIGA